MSTLFLPSYWLAIKDGDARARSMQRRHYSCSSTARRRDDKRFVGPGERVILLTASEQALIIWCKFRTMDNQEGVNCKLFRNEAPHLHKSSTLLKAAQKIAWEKWPGERLYTYVDPRSVQTEIPGYCFRLVGWQECGRTKARDLIILEKFPSLKTGD